MTINAKMFQAIMMAMLLGQSVKPVQRTVKLVSVPQHTRYMWGDISDIAGKELKLIRAEPMGRLPVCFREGPCRCKSPGYRNGRRHPRWKNINQNDHRLEKPAPKRDGEGTRGIAEGGGRGAEGKGKPAPRGHLW